MKWRAAQWVVLIAAFAWAASLGAWHLTDRVDPLNRAEAVTLDWRHHLTAAPGRPDGIVIYAIDDQAVFMAGGYPIRRRRLAQSIDMLAAAGAAAIGIDVLLLDPSGEVDDAAIEQALVDRPVILAAGGLAGGPITLSPDWRNGFGGGSADGEGLRFPTLTRLARPLPRFRDHAVDAPALLMVDSGGTPRYAPMLFTPNDAPMTVAPSFPLAMASAAEPDQPRLGPEAIALGGRIVPLDRDSRLALRFLGPAGTIETRSLATLWRAAPPTDLEGKLVLIGATATGAGDAFSTPYDARLPGVEVLATAVANLVDGTALRRDQTVRWIDAGAAIVLTMITVGVVLATPGWVGPIAGAGAMTAWLGITVLAFSLPGWWLSATLPIAAALPAMLLGLAVRQTLDRRDSSRLGRTAKAYGALQSPIITKALAADPTYLEEPRYQEATIMFLDLVGFTPLADRLGPDGARALLAEFHRQVADAVHGAGGYVSSWLGDGMMVVFGLPDPGPEDTAHAFATALDILDRLPGVPRPATHAIRLKIGITVGPVMLSRLGGGGHGHITAIGTTVNRAARLMTAAGVAGTALIADPEICERLPAEMAAKLVPLDEPLTLAGFASPVSAVALTSDRRGSGGHRQMRR